MQPSASLGNWVVAWAVIAGVILVIRMSGRVGGVGLVAAYLLTFAMNHWLGGAIYVLQPGYARSDPDQVAIGFQQATYAVAAFGIGSVLLAPVFRRWVQRVDPPVPAAALAGPARTIVGLGLVLMLVLVPVLSRVPTLSALLSQGLSVVIVGLGLACWSAWQTRRVGAFLGWLAATLCLPFLTIVTQGFLGYGTVAALAIMTFIATFARPRWVTALAAVVVCYLGLSLFVTYMRDRSDIRDTVNSGSSLTARVAQVSQTLTTIEWFDLSNIDHLNRVDDRLNQNILVGKAVSFLDAGLAPYAQFDTVWNGLLALIPRVIWPTKPLAAGSGELVSRYTGVTFAAGTSVGIGNVMEGYVSFGTPGVVIAFLLIGLLVGLVDMAAGQRLRDGNWRGFLLWYLPGLSLLQVIGSLVEITSTAGAALIVAFLVTRLLRPPRAAPARRSSPARRPAWTRA